jgi:hypothetical protein
VRVPPHRIGVDVSVEVLIRIELRTTSGQKEQAKPRELARQTRLITSAAVHGMLVPDEEDSLPGLAQQAAQEWDEHRTRDPALENHEC